MRSSSSRCAELRCATPGQRLATRAAPREVDAAPSMARDSPLLLSAAAAAATALSS